MNFELNEQQLSIQKMARDFTEKKVAPKVLERDETREYDRSLYEDLCSMGFIGLPYEKEYGGEGLGYMEYALAIEEISKVDPSLSVSFSVATSLYGGSLRGVAKALSDPHGRQTYRRNRRRACGVSGRIKGFFVGGQSYAGGKKQSRRSMFKLWVYSVKIFIRCRAPLSYG